jgi:ribA/ribD-fused uncharacterized protein
VAIDGLVWPTVEHYFQAMKFPQDSALREKIRAARWAGRAKQLAEANRDSYSNEWWVSVRDEVMRRALRAKFEQHPDLCSVLLGTGDEELVEHTSSDNYWGDGGDGTGVNRLGRLLMEIRRERRERSRRVE